jgi:thiol-disulfide isomerase/thioredoxin
MVSPEQQAVDDFQESHDTVSLNKSIRLYAIDTTKWSRHRLHNIVFIQVSRLDDKRYIVIPDANNDYSFEDDNVYYAKIPTDSLQLGILRISEDHNILLRNIEYYYDSTTYKMDYMAGFSLEIYSQAGVRKDSVALSLINENLKEGHIRINGRAAKVIIIQSWLSGVNFDKFTEITFLPDTVQYIPHLSYVRPGDTAFVNNVKLVVTSLSADGRKLSFVQLFQNDTASFGTEVGDRAYDFSLPDEQGNIYQPSHNSKGKYILLDFWGTWCHPCLNNIPDIKKFYQQSNISSAVDYIGVCVDDLTRKDTVLKKIKNIGTPWKNVLVDRADSYSDNRSIVNLYKVMGYPTYILISPEGRIISRYEGEDHLPQLFQDLSSAKMKRDN